MDLPFVPPWPGWVLALVAIAIGCLLCIVHACWRSSSELGTSCTVFRAPAGRAQQPRAATSEEGHERLRLLQINVWSGSTYEVDWWRFGFIPFAGDDREHRYQSLVRYIQHYNPDIICVNEAMPWYAYPKRLAADLGMDCCVHLGVAGIRIGPLQIPCISEGDAILAKPHLKLKQLGRRRLTGAVLTNQVSFSLDDATQAIVAQVTLPSGIDVIVCCTHWHAYLLDTPETHSRIRDAKEDGATTMEVEQMEKDIKRHTEIRKQE